MRFPVQALFPNIRQAFVLLLLVILLDLLVSFPLTWLEGREFLSVPMLDLIAFILTSGLAIWFGIWLRGHRDFRFYQFNYWIIPMIIVLTCGLFFINEFISSLIPVPDSIQELFEELLQPGAITFISAVLAAPLLEEIFFRGIILDGLLKTQKPWIAILISSVIFAAAHLNPWQFIGAVFIGSVIGWLYWRTRSIIPGLILHVANNGIGYLLLWSGEWKNEVNYDASFFGMLAGSILLSAFLLWLIYNMTVREQS